MLTSGCASDCSVILFICFARVCAAPSMAPSGLLESEEQLPGCELHLSSAPELPGETGVRRLLFPPCSTSISTSMPRSQGENKPLRPQRVNLPFAVLTCSPKAGGVGCGTHSTPGHTVSTGPAPVAACQQESKWMVIVTISRAELPKSWPKSSWLLQTHCTSLFRQQNKTLTPQVSFTASESRTGTFPAPGRTDLHREGQDQEPGPCVARAPSGAEAQELRAV